MSYAGPFGAAYRTELVEHEWMASVKDKDVVGRSEVLQSDLEQKKATVNPPKTQEKHIPKSPAITWTSQFHYIIWEKSFFESTFPFGTFPPNVPQEVPFSSTYTFASFLAKATEVREWQLGPETVRSGELFWGGEGNSKGIHRVRTWALWVGVIAVLLLCDFMFEIVKVVDKHLGSVGKVP